LVAETCLRKRKIQKKKKKQEEEEKMTDEKDGRVPQRTSPPLQFRTIR
jgi:hypothetical protein